MAGEAALGRAVLELATDDNKFNTGLAEAKAAAGGLDKTFAGAGAQASTFGERLGMLGKQAGIAGTASKVLSSALGSFTVAGLATNAITALGGALQTLISDGSKLPAIAASFQRLTAAVNQSGAAMLGSMRAGTKSLVSDLDLMQSANKALLLGLPVTAASMGDLANTARVLGKAMGQDATKSLDDLITALGRSSPMILDNLGLTVKVGEANEAYARKIGKTADALTDAEKKTAFYEAAMEAARIKTEQLGEQTMTLGERATAAWTTIGNVVTKAAADMNVGIGAATSSGRGFVDFLEDVIKFGPAVAVQMASMREELKGLDAARRGAMGKDIVLESYESTLAKVRAAAAKTTAAIVPLNAEQRSLALQFAATGKNAAAIAEELNKVQGWTVQAAAVEKVIAAHKAGTTAATQYGKAIEDLAGKISGREAIKSADMLVAALERLGPIGKLTKDAQIDIAKTMEAAIAVYVAAGKTIPAAYQQIAMAARATSKTVSDAMKLQIEAMQAAWGKTGGIKLEKIPIAFGFEDSSWATRESLKATRSFAAVVAQIDTVAVGKAAAQRMKDAFGPNFWQQTFGSSSQFGAGLGAALMGAIQGGGSSVNAAGAFVGTQLGSSIAGKLGASLLKDGAGILSKSLGGLLNAVLPGIGALLGPLLGKVWNGIKGLFGGADGRKLVEDFAGSMGGFDALHDKLLALGDAGEQLWIKLTQGVGRNDAKAAAAAIDEVTAALSEQETQQDESTAATEEAALATIETATQASAALDALGPKIDANKGEWADWSESVTGEIDRVAGALRGLTIPSPSVPVEGMAAGGFGRVQRPTLFYSGGNEDYAFSGEGRSFGLGAMAQRPIHLESVTTLDGRVVARNQTRHIPNELARVGIRSR